jgi:hypothetical protein
MAKTKYHIIIYEAMTNPYARFVRVCDAMIWDVAADALAVAPTYGDTDVQLTTNTSVVGIPVTIPASLPAGEYDMLFYDAGTPANTDVVELGKRIQWDGKNLLGVPIDM